MMCPNCRCFVPESMSRCHYCGYEFPEGSTKTVRAEDMYRNRLLEHGDYDGYYSDGYHRVPYNKDARSGYYPTRYEVYYYYPGNTPAQKNNDKLRILLVLCLGLSAVTILLLLALLILLL